jgi:hypothetical protein
MASLNWKLFEERDRSDSQLNQRRTLYSAMSWTDGQRIFLVQAQHLD